jgi:hypothetical protein
MLTAQLLHLREQLFFLSFARIWATNIKPQTAVSLGSAENNQIA